MIIKSLESSLEKKVSSKVASTTVHTDQEISTLNASMKEILDFLGLFHQELNLQNSSYADLKANVVCQNDQVKLRAKIRNLKNAIDPLKSLGAYPVLYSGLPPMSENHPKLAGKKINLKSKSLFKQ